MSKFSYKTLFIIFFFLLIGVVILSRFVLPNKKVSAAWWNGSWNYRQAINISSHNTNESNVYIITTVNIGTTIKSQTDNGDFRFITQNGDILPYYISSGTGTTSITFHIQFSSFPSGAQTIFTYYGNPSIDNGFSASDFATEASNYTIGSLSAEEAGGGPIAYWKFDEGVGTTAYDSTNNQNNGVLGVAGSVPAWQTEDQCISGKCLYFNGTSSCKVTVPNSSSIQTIDSQTISMWIKPTVFSSRRNPINKAFGGEGTMTLETGGQISYYWGTAGVNGSPYQGFGSSVISLNNWSYITIVRDLINNKLTWYLNGKQTTQTTPSYVQAKASTADLIIGTGYAGSFIGYIDEVKIYPYARTADQIKLDYNSRGSSKGSSSNLGIQSSTAPDLKSKLIAYWKFDEGSGATLFNSTNIGASMNAVLGTSSNSIPTWTDGKFGKALSFGPNSLVQTSRNYSPLEYRADKDLSISSWINVSSSESNGGYILSKPWNGSGRYNYNLNYNSNRTITFHVGSSNVDYYLSTATTIPPNEWHQVTATLDSSQNMNIYFDGKLVKNGNANLSGWTINSSNVQVAIGCIFPYGSYCAAGTSTAFNGLIDEVKIYNAALTPDEVKQDYNQGSSIQMGQTNQTIGGTTTSLEYCLPGDTSYCASPIAEWNFEENIGTTTRDTSGNNNHGVFGTGNSAPTWTLGANNKGAGLNWDGNTNKYISTSNTLSTIGNQSWTVSSWVKIPSSVAGRVGTLIGNYPDSPTINLEVHSVGQIRLYWNGIDMYGTTNLKDDKWHYLTWVRDETLNKFFMYIDNSLEIGFTGSTDLTLTAPFWIGSDKRSGGLTWHGKIDNIKIYDYARTPAQIAYDYNKGAPIAHWKLDECQGGIAYNSAADPATAGLGSTGSIIIGASGTQNSLGTCQVGTSAAWTNGASGHTNSSLNFDGTDDYIRFSNSSSLNFNTSNFTLSTWTFYKPNSKVNIILGKRSYPPGYIMYYNTNNSITVQVNDSAGHPYNVGTPSCQNTWCHLIAVINRNNNRLYFYVNGTLFNTVDISNTTGSIDNSGWFGIGADQSDTSNVFSGQIDDVRIYNYALTAEQVKTLYNGGAVNFN